MNKRVGPQWQQNIGQHLQQWKQKSNKSIYDRLERGPLSYSSNVPHMPLLNRLSRDTDLSLRLQHPQHNGGSVFGRLAGAPKRRRPYKTEENLNQRQLKAKEWQKKRDERRKGARQFQKTVEGEGSALAAIAVLSDAPESTTEWDSVIQEAIDGFKITQQEIDQKELVLGLVEQALGHSFPGATCRLFGSSVTRLGFKDSDADINVSFGYDLYSYNSPKDAKAKAAKLTRQLAKCFWNHTELRQVNMILHCRVPLIKLSHQPSQTRVDLSFRSALGVANSSLVRLLCDAHPQVRPFIMFLRLWAAAHKVSGPGRPNNLLTNYSLSLLALFACMAREQKLVPSLADLRKQPYDSSLLDGWECGHGTDVAAFWQQQEKEPPASVDGGVLGLALEFFELYGGLDCRRWAICPLVGSLVNRNVLRAAAAVSAADNTAADDDEESIEEVIPDDGDDCIKVNEDAADDDCVMVKEGSSGDVDDDCVVMTDNSADDVIMLSNTVATDAVIDTDTAATDAVIDTDTVATDAAVSSDTAVSTDTVETDAQITADTIVEDEADITDTVVEDAVVVTNNISDNINNVAAKDNDAAIAASIVSSSSGGSAAGGSGNSLPEALTPYLAKMKQTKSKTASLCVIDLFALDSNITSQYQPKSVKSFQNKCRQSAAILKEVLKKEKPLSALFISL